MDIRLRIHEIAGEIIEIRRKLHACPELSEQEEETAKVISDSLNRWDIIHQTGIGGHGVVGLIRGQGAVHPQQPFVTVGIRADMDALPIEESTGLPFQSRKPGIMHACGHDIHMAVLLGSAKIFKEMAEELNGNIKLFFQPAEETVGGAWPMIQAGCLKEPQVDAVLGLHIAPELEVGKVEFCRGQMYAASTEFQIAVQGKGCHGAHPEKGVDSILVAASVVTALQSIITRNLPPVTPAVITVGRIQGGSKNNIVAPETILSGIIRALDQHDREFLKTRLQEVSEQVAAGFGARALVTFEDSYPALSNDRQVVELLSQAAAKVLGQEAICFQKQPSMGSDDFAYFSQVVKSAYFHLGCLEEGQTIPQTLHSGDLNPAEACLEIGILVEVLGALELLKQRP
ncbi:amidohydrolase [Aminipila butyrica]|uniref:Amidohydrolase n=1 Tax=Aminipila butyrica TaxID=433296 RepID=A0A858BXY5_9FIRM|nr:M20 family metallopeptidase [Aminipila butyrica]QIB68926.1 amidohydrolase [Aminipila butyrica]